MKAKDRADMLDTAEDDGPVARVRREGFAAIATRESPLGGLQAVRDLASALAPACPHFAQQQDESDQILEQASRCGLVDELGEGGEGVVLNTIRAGFDNAPRQLANGHTTFEDSPKPAADLPALEFLDATTLAGRDVPPRRWLVPHRIPRPNVTMLSGDGAAGKTTIALQLVAATVRGTDWLGSVVDQPGPAIFFTAEEDQDEVHRRLDAITAHQGIGFADLAGLYLLCRPNDDPALGIAEGKSGVIRATPLFDRLVKAATEIRPALIVIEAAADVFAGNENDRAQVRQFVGLLRRLAIDSDAAVVLIAHPSLTGLNSGTGTSGSTGWNNSVRSRLYFKAPKAPARGDDTETDSDARQLEVMKSNYGPAGEVVRLRWQRGVFVPEGTLGTVERVSAEAEIDAAYLDCLDAIAARGDRVGPHTGRIYAPSIFQKMPQARGYRAKAFAAAQERLFNAGRIEVKPYGPPSKQGSMIVRKAAQ